ncbi:unnamed protein product [Enterobius vermicularis]|uniref:CortBP2 domain-containing protein n=1 Tax=Enterobius vermicularis TaxID=51028 RepID=A0A0N4VFV9_ENTVE|nr:unnamed protein product [Enterobius vermicularis]
MSHALVKGDEDNEIKGCFSEASTSEQHRDAFTPILFVDLLELDSYSEMSLEATVKGICFENAATESFSESALCFAGNQTKFQVSERGEGSCERCEGISSSCSDIKRSSDGLVRVAKRSANFQSSEDNDSSYEDPRALDSESRRTYLLVVLFKIFTLDKHSLRKSLRKKLKGTEASSDGDLVSKDKFKEGCESPCIQSCSGVAASELVTGNSELQCSDCSVTPDLKKLVKRYSKLRFLLVMYHERITEVEKENEALKGLCRNLQNRFVDEKRRIHSEVTKLQKSLRCIVAEMNAYHKALLSAYDEFDEKRRSEKRRLGEVLDSYSENSRKMQDVIKVRSAEIEQLRTALNQMKREFAVQDRENYLARQRAADAEKKLSDQLYLACKTKCPSCKVFEKNKDILYGQIADKTVIIEKAAAEIEELKGKLETNEKTVQQLQGEKARLTFEKKSWEKEAMRLEEELKSMKFQSGAFSAVLTPQTSNNSTTSDDIIEQHLTKLSVATQTATLSGWDRSLLIIGLILETRISSRAQQDNRLKQGKDDVASLDLLPLKVDVPHPSAPNAFSSWLKHPRTTGIKSETSAICEMEPNISTQIVNCGERSRNASHNEESAKKRCLEIESSSYVKNKSPAENRTANDSQFLKNASKMQTQAEMPKEGGLSDNLSYKIPGRAPDQGSDIAENRNSLGNAKIFSYHSRKSPGCPSNDSLTGRRPSKRRARKGRKGKAQTSRRDGLCDLSHPILSRSQSSSRKDGKSTWHKGTATESRRRRAHLQPLRVSSSRGASAELGERRTLPKEVSKKQLRQVRLSNELQVREGDPQPEINLSPRGRRDFFMECPVSSGAQSFPPRTFAFGSSFLDENTHNAPLHPKQDSWRQENTRFRLVTHETWNHPSFQPREEVIGFRASVRW